MSMTDDNTNELDSYGVWVKNGSNNPSQEESANEAETLSTDSLDLPDFDSTDFSDMFKDDTQFSSDQSQDLSFSDDLDSTLSTDELANITDSANISIEEVTPEPETDTEFNSEVSFEDNIEETSDDMFTTETSESTPDFGEDVVVEDVSAPASSDGFEEVSFEDEEISLDDFMTEGFSDESVAAGNNGYEPGAEPKAPAPSSGTEELSLDDFLDGDSFDMAPPEVKQQQEDVIEDEPPLEMEINFDDSADTVETEENISVDSDWEDDTDEDTSTESIETEEVSLDDFGSTFEAVETKSTSGDSDISTEEVDLSDFGIDANAEETPITQNVEESKNKEVVVDYDLSVGDENTAAAPVVNEIKSESQKQEEKEEPKAVIPENSTVVENSLLQQIVADLSGLKDEINRLKQNLEDIKTAEAAPTAPVADTPAEEEIVFEETKEEVGFFGEDDGDETIALSCDELNNIMNNAAFSEATESSVTEDEVVENSFVDAPDTVTAEETFAEDSIVEEEVSFDDTPVTEEPVIEDTIVEEEVSFDDTPVTDEPVIEDTIVEEEVSFDDTPVTDEPVIEDTIVEEEVSFDDTPVTEEPVIEDTIVEEEVSFDDTPVTEEPVIEDTIVEDTSELEITDEVTLENDSISTPVIEEETTELSFDETESEPVFDVTEPESETIEEDTSFEENTPVESIFDEAEPEIEEEIAFDFTDENLEEPVIDEIAVDEDDSDLETDDLPEEISIPKEDEMFVESTSTDFMDSVKDNTDDTIVSDDIEEASLEDDIPLELPEDALTESEAENIIEEDDVPTVEKVLEEGSTEISFEDTKIPETQDSEEPVFDETAVDISEAAIPEETPVMDDTEIAFEETSDVTIEEPAEDKFAEVDNLDNNLTDDNMNYLTAKENKTDADSVNITSDLKQDIKSVLLYMDQLLENLPEEKIVEFAKSDEFTTYKKLFTELGLS